MALMFNGIEIPIDGDVIFNGTSVNQVYFNGTLLWQKGEVAVPPPPAPSFCSATDGSFESFVRISWGYSHYQAGYEVYRSDDGNTYEKIGDVVGEDLWLDDGNVIPETTYYYKVRAYWIEDPSLSKSEFSETDTGYAEDDITDDPPTMAPSSLNASDGTYADKIVLVWNNGSESNASFVNIYRDGRLHDSVVFGANTYSDVSVSTNSSYVYYLKFANAAGEGPSSNSDTGSTNSESGYVLKSGDYMTGFLELNADPQLALHAVTKQYVDGRYVDRTGDTMTGNLNVPTINNGTPWTSNNDGPLSGLDADTLDGHHASYFYSPTNPPSDAGWDPSTNNTCDLGSSLSSTYAVYELNTSYTTADIVLDSYGALNIRNANRWTSIMASHLGINARPVFYNSRLSLPVFDGVDFWWFVRNESSDDDAVYGIKRNGTRDYALLWYNGGSIYAVSGTPVALENENDIESVKIKEVEKEDSGYRMSNVPGKEWGFVNLKVEGNRTEVDVKFKKPFTICFGVDLTLASDTDLFVTYAATNVTEYGFKLIVKCFSSDACENIKIRYSADGYGTKIEKDENV